MPIRAFLKICFLGSLSAVLFPILTSPQSPPASPPTQAGTQPSQTGQSGYVLKVTTRLVTVDVVATDAHGNPVRDLKPEDIQIFEEHKQQEKIEHFQFLERLKGAGLGESGAPVPASASVIPPTEISNQLPLEKLKIPPIVLLMDSLNTQTENQLLARANMIQLLRNLPSETPVAIFLLGSSLRVLQTFTSDPSLLRAALDQSVSGAMLTKNPALDTKSTSNYIQDATVGSGANQGLASQIGEIQNFEKEEYAMSLDLRAKETLNALAQIGQHLSGIPGRKILIWVSESFPISIAPDPATGNNPFAGAREYTDQVRAVANTLTDAQVAVYPVDIRGVKANEVLAASQSVSRPGGRLTGPAIGRQLNAEDMDLQQSQGTMMELAQDTGGKPCTNNDVSGCLVTALKDSSTYYELSFYPKNVNWDGRFHKITLKTSRSGVKLTYRRGFYALDASALAKKQAPEDHMRQACADQLPSTSIPLTVRPAPPGQAGEPQGGLHYLLLISATGLGAAKEGGSYDLNVRLADCEFAQKDTVFRFHEREMPKNVSGETYRIWQSAGIPFHVALMPAADTRRVRMVVLDVSSGLTGAIDIPVRAEEIAKAAAPVTPPAPVESTPYVELPDKVKGASQPKILASLTFHLGSAASGTLDWGGDALTYQEVSDMPLDKSAGAFSGYAFGGRFHCQEGHFVPVDSGDGEPVLHFTFHNHQGKMAVVDLKGDQPSYLGDLAVDPSAQALFDLVWKAAHCQQQ
jgi:VWFA-related protein